MKRILITGAAGFIGHHFCDHVLRTTDWDIVAMVRVGGAGSMRRLNEVMDDHPEWDKRLKVVWHDFRSPVNENTAEEVGWCDYFCHLAALTHVDNSIKDPRGFVEANVVGTLNALEFARTLKPEWFNLFSTDEVYGPAPDGVWYKEDDRYNATNPYAAAKAGAEQLANSYANCYGLPVLTTNTMNVIGERAGLEKFIPLLMRKILLRERIYIHADPTRTRAGSRHYVHARNVASAVCFLLENAPHGRLAQRYNIVGEKEMDNESLAKFVAEAIGEPVDYELTDFHSARPGHDLRYALDGSKLAALGYVHPVGFEASLEKTIAWTMKHKHWIGL